MPEIFPIPLILHCPRCHAQHIDQPKGEWTNPPHRSHECQDCGLVWRPADVPTTGVEKIETRGERDTWPPKVSFDGNTSWVHTDETGGKVHKTRSVGPPNSGDK